MNKFHINNNGLPSICKSEGKNCSYGDGDFHFNTAEEAQLYADKISESEYGILFGIGSGFMKCKNVNFIDYFSTRKDIFEVPVSARGRELIKILGKDVSFYFDNLIMSGVVFSVDEIESIVEITIFTSKGVEKFDLNKESINSIVASNDNYFTTGYEAILRKIEVPTYKFRYTKKELSDLKGKYVKVSYDESLVDGLVSEVFYEGSVGIIVSGENEKVTVDTYKIKSLEVIGQNEDDYKIFKESEKITSIIKIIDTPAFIQDNKKYYPKNKIDSYLKDVINLKMGKSVDLSKYDRDWISEIHQRIEDYAIKAFSFFKEYNEKHNVKEGHELNINLNNEVHNYYKNIFKSLKRMINEIENTDWTVFNKTQNEGVINSLICIYENDMILK